MESGSRAFTLFAHFVDIFLRWQRVRCLVGCHLWETCDCVINDHYSVVEHAVEVIGPCLKDLLIVYQQVWAVNTAERKLFRWLRSVCGFQCIVEPLGVVSFCVVFDLIGPGNQLRVLHEWELGQDFALYVGEGSFLCRAGEVILECLKQAVFFSRVERYGCRHENWISLVRSPARLIFFPRIDDNHCDRNHSSLAAVRCFDNGYLGKQPVAWKEYCAN